MKPSVILLGLLCAALAFGFYKRHTGAKAELEKATQDGTALTNKVRELTTRIEYIAVSNEVAHSNLISNLDRRTTEVTVLSNRLVQTRLLLKQAQTDTQEAQLSLQAKAGQWAVAEAQREDLTRQIESLGPLQKQLSQAASQLAEVTTDRELWAQEAQRLRVEKAEMLAKMENMSFLRIQLAKVEDEAELKRRYAQGRVPAASDRRVQLELQEDHTVRAVPPPGK